MTNKDRNYWMEVEGPDRQLLQYYWQVAQNAGMYCTYVKLIDQKQVFTFSYATVSDTHDPEPLKKLYKHVGSPAGFTLRHSGGDT